MLTATLTRSVLVTSQGTARLLPAGTLVRVGESRRAGRVVIRPLDGIAKARVARDAVACA